MTTLKLFHFSSFGYPVNVEYVQVTEAQAAVIIAANPGRNPDDLQVLEVDGSERGTRRLTKPSESRYYLEGVSFDDFDELKGEIVA